MDTSRDTFHASGSYQPLLREIGLDAEAIFEDPRIVAWRSIPERQNCTLDAELLDGRHVRWHIKRHQPTGRKISPAQEEVRGIELLQARGVPTVPLVGWGRLADGRSFIITEELAGFRAADKLIAEGTIPFESVLESTADLAGRLHGAGLHHRDLYLCHFFAKSDGGGAELRLIDAARVRALPRWFARRWVVKDLAQFWYSTLALPISEEQRRRWLARYAGARSQGRVNALESSVARKSRWIARHDARLKARAPARNVSIPGA